MSSYLYILASRSTVLVSNSKFENDHGKVGCGEKSSAAPILNSGKELPSILGDGVNTSATPTKVDLPLNSQQLTDIVEKLQAGILHTRREIKFEINEILGRPVVSVLDQVSREVIRQFPSEEVVELAERVAVLK